MSTFYTKGIILSKTDRGEADQLFNIYTKDRGKVVALGRATKKMQSKLNGSLQPFTVLRLMIANGKVFDHVAGVDIVIHYSEVMKDLKKIVLGSHGLELVDSLTKLGNGDDRIFNLLDKYLEAINDNDFADNDWQLVKQAFTIKLLTLLGFKPPVEVADDFKKLDSFLQSHLDSELKTNKFLVRLGS